MDGLPALGEVIRQYGLTAKRSLGQNFLLDLNLTSRIARAAGDLSGYSILEIGAGPGGLTRALLMNGAEEVIAVEQDPRFLPALTEISNHYKGKLRLIPGNALETNFEALIKEKPVKIIANLPYNIGTALLIQWLTIEKWPPWYNSMTLMFQKEVAQRIVAQPGNSSYGRLGVLAGWRTEASILFDINRKAFYSSPSCHLICCTSDPSQKSSGNQP